MSWQIDSNHTQIEFSAKHFGMITVRGYFREFVATGDIDPTHPENSFLEIRIEVGSLTTNNPERDAHLRSSDFLAVDTYPTITLRSTNIQRVHRDRYAMTGDLTIKGITRPVTLDVQRYGEVNDERLGHRVAFNVEGQINRKDFGMNFDLLADNRLVVGDEIKLYVEVEVVEVADAPTAAAA
jgi:polyisoprenoid-binding protein YceI